MDRLTARELATEHGQKVASSRGRGTATSAVQNPAMGDAQDEAEGKNPADLRERQCPAERDAD